MSVLVTVCARGGSKGVKEKNIRPLLGKPLIAHTIEQAKRWGRAAHIVVSTDSDAIATVARQCGAEVPFMRPAVLAGDTVPKLPVLRHALQSSEAHYGVQFATVMDLDPTAPIRAPDDLEGAYQQFCAEEPLTLFSVVPAHKNPYFNMVELDDRGRARLCKTLPNAAVYRRQDTPPVYNLNASIYLYRRAFLLEESNRTPISDDSRVYVMHELSAHDIDREIDFQFLEFLVRERLVTL